MTNERAGKEASAIWQPMGSQENVSGVGLDIDKTFELKASRLLDWVSSALCNQSNFGEIPGFKHLLLVDMHVM